MKESATEPESEPVFFFFKLKNGRTTSGGVIRHIEQGRVSVSQMTSVTSNGRGPKETILNRFKYKQAEKDTH